MLLLYLPLTYIFGFKENVSIYGSEAKTELPSLQQKSFKEKEFQNLFEEWWNSHFALRNAMLKIKNQIYDWVNLGKIHSGCSNAVIEGKHGYLFEKRYFYSLCRNCKPLPDNFIKLKELNDILKKKNIELYFVLAPNKAVTYSDYMPSRYKYFLGKDCKYHKTIEKELNRLGIKNFDAQSLVSSIREKGQYQPFNITGTHWNHYGAGITAQKAAKKFNWGKIEIKSIEERDKPYTTERDIADLLNLVVEYRPEQKFQKIIFNRNKLLPGVTTIIGNSFSNEFKDSFIAGLGTYVNHYENLPLVLANIEDIKKSTRIIFVYTDIAVMNHGDQLYKKIDFMLKYLKNDMYCEFSKELPKGLYINGLSGIEEWGRWSDGSIVEFCFSKLPKKDLIFRFNTFAFLTKKRPYQNVEIFINEKHFATWNYKLGKPLPNTVIEIPEKLMKNTKNLTVRFEIENPVSPQEMGISGDTRKLAIGFKTFSIDEK